MLDFAGCSWLHFCTVFMNCSVRSSGDAFQLQEYREACASLHSFFCFKEMTQNSFSGRVSAEADQGDQHGEKQGDP